jgi:CRP-like cAMP-binding protein
MNRVNCVYLRVSGKHRTTLNNMKTVIEKFETLISKLDQKSQEFYHSSILTEDHQKNKILVEEGKVCKYSYIVLEGCIRKYYLKDGIEITSEFIFPGEMAVSFGSFLKRKPSNEFIQTIENTKVMLIPFSVFEFMQKEHPSIVQTNFDVLVDYSQWLENRLYHLQFHTAKERYLILLKSQPEIIQRIPLIYISPPI